MGLAAVGKYVMAFSVEAYDQTFLLSLLQIFIAPDWLIQI